MQKSFIRVASEGFKAYATMRVDIAFAAGRGAVGVPFETDL